MNPIVVVGIGTDVGKTVVSAALSLALGAAYWKPISCGRSDAQQIQEWFSEQITVIPTEHHLEAPVSPHQAASEQGVTLPDQLHCPVAQLPLVVETAGGIFTPVRPGVAMLDLFSGWTCDWVLVTRHYLGSINHTLLTLDALERRAIRIAALVVSGGENPASEQAIRAAYPEIPLMRIPELSTVNRRTLTQAAHHWKKETQWTPLLKPSH